jgi:hypothetical protein
MELVDIHYPKAERIRVVLDNLSTHTGGHSGAMAQNSLTSRLDRIARLRPHRSMAHPLIELNPSGSGNQPLC